MIVTRTPLRISFAGGGSDFADFYRVHGGRVLATTIDKYVHVILQNRFDDKIRVGYSTTELREHLDEVQHELVRESMRTVGIERSLEVSTMADVPSTGTGLGSSSSVTVGLLNALYAHSGDPQTRERLARDAVRIEIEVLAKPIGKQDQYIAAYGGMRKLTFARDESVVAERVRLPADTMQFLDDRLMLFYTGLGRDSGAVLKEQKSRIETNAGTLLEMVRMVDEMESLLIAGNLDDFGRAMDHCWSLKRSLASTVTNSFIDDVYRSATRAGALGGKITGAGGGGFLLLFCEQGSQRAVRRAIHGLKELVFHLEPDGSKVLFST